MRSMTWLRYRSGGSPAGMKKEKTRTIAVPSSAGDVGDPAHPVQLGASGAPTGILPMGEPIAETRTPASSSAARKAASCRR